MHMEVKANYQRRRLTLWKSVYRPKNLTGLSNYAYFPKTSAIMSALADRDTNLQPTSHPISSKKENAAGEENRPQDTQHYKQLQDKVAKSNRYARVTYIEHDTFRVQPGDCMRNYG